MNHIIAAIKTLVKEAGGDYNSLVEVKVDAHNITVVQRTQGETPRAGARTKTIVKAWRV